MLSRETAIALAEAGVVWQPRPGDRFMVRVDEMGEEVFQVSEMTVDVAHYPEGTHVRFNGTTEWALDSIELARTIWLPHEGQLRDLLGDRFASLVREGRSWVVTLDDERGRRDVCDEDVEEAYAQAVLSL